MMNNKLNNKNIRTLFADLMSTSVVSFSFAPITVLAMTLALSLLA